ncbi:hypothetical protein HYR99_26880 [Candidatus Poribacteria bacterium]|nr:hypothetical protein [Candidatus Poribacteria bacterium]
MCKQNLSPDEKDQKSERILRAEDFIVPEGWEPDIPSLKRIVEMGRQIAAALGPTLVQEILDEFITTKEPEDQEDSRRR